MTQPWEGFPARPCQQGIHGDLGIWAADTPAPKSSKKGEVQEDSGKLSYFKVD